MKSRLALVLTAALAAAACSSQDDAAVAARSGSDAPVAGPGGGAVVASRIAISDAATRHRFAAMPDRGALTVYPKTPVVRRDGAYTWHRADLSESHARSAVGGVLAFTTPAGELLRFRYERHVEHANGDWTWIGSIVGRKAEEAIITFGAKAAFGTIAQPDKEPLRLTIRDGASWLVETDPRELARMRTVDTRPTGPDFIVAPELATQPRLAGSGAAEAPIMSGAATAAAGATAATTVDLVLGYTPGFVSYYGGESQALTRLNNMVDVTNEAYVNSQVDARVRLVRTVLVNYTDANDNKTALEQLTGYQNGTRTTPAAAFSELRAARDQYGADVVSLVRRFTTPENEGCGIAWLLGGGQRGGISAGSEYFGYSVVSDGRDAGTDGKTYICRDETLAHEIGHNLGSAHDRDTADGDDNVLQTDEYGVFSYSFGYKTDGGNGNFYTIMAYGESGQTRHRVFSNPRVSICGSSGANLPCGTSVADNARSISQTVATLASFRAKVVPDTQPPAAKVRGDIDGDSRSDLLWQETSEGRFGFWLMNGSTVSQMSNLPLTLGYRSPAAGDFDGNGRLDVIWTSDRRDIWLWSGTGAGTFISAYLGTYGEGWKITAAGDVNGDGKDDLLWVNPVEGRLGYWLMNGSTVSSSNNIPLTRGYVLAASGDVNADGYLDLFLTSSKGDLWLWTGTGTGQFGSQQIGSYPSDWTIVAAADMDADGKSDLVWHNGAVGRLGYWLMDGASVRQMSNEPVTVGYRIAAVGDYNGDRRADIVWTSDRLDLWLWSGGTAGFASAYLGQYPGTWQVIDPVSKSTR